MKSKLKQAVHDALDDLFAVAGFALLDEVRRIGKEALLAQADLIEQRSGTLVECMRAEAKAS